MTTLDSNSRTGRRDFLARSTGIALGSLSIVPIAASQARKGFPAPPPPADPSAQDKTATQGIDPQTAKRVMAAKNEKEFREGVEKLFELATELRDELAHEPRMNVLSVRMYKKTEEIEKLAKQLKGKAKGG
jgi:hypothetical protein